MYLRKGGDRGYGQPKGHGGGKGQGKDWRGKGHPKGGKGNAPRRHGSKGQEQSPRPGGTNSDGIGKGVAYFHEPEAERSVLEEDGPPFRYRTHFGRGLTSPFQRWLDETLRFDPVGPPPLVFELFGGDGILAEELDLIEDIRHELRDREMRRAQGYDYRWVGLEPRLDGVRTLYDVVREDRCNQYRERLRAQLRRELEARARQEFNLSLIHI